MENALFSYEKASSMAMRINSRSVQVSVLERLFSAYWKIAERHEEFRVLLIDVFHLLFSVCVSLLVSVGRVFALLF